MTRESLEGVSVIPPAPEESPVAQSDVNIGLKNDQIFQRYLVRRIFREVEFKITEPDGTSHIGYITGFDDKCIQMSITPVTDIDDPRAVLVFWPLRRIEETGGKVDDLEPDQRSKIRSYSHALRAQCEKTLVQQGNTAGQANNRRSGERNGTSPAFSDGL